MANADVEKGRAVSSHFLSTCEYLTDPRSISHQLIFSVSILAELFVGFCTLFYCRLFVALH